MLAELGQVGYDFRGRAVVNPMPDGYLGEAEFFTGKVFRQSQWIPTRNITIFASISNLLDKKYWRWSDVRGLEASSPVIDAYTAPGRSFSLGARYDF